MSINIIAEFCQNHNGDYEILREMIHQAADAGATYGKIQTIFADDLTYRKKFEKGKIINDKVSVIKRPYMPEYDRLKTLELDYKQHYMFIEDCNKYGIKPLTTAFTRGSMNRIIDLKWDTVKVASYDCGSHQLIEDLSKHFKHLIISTGASYDEEIIKTAEIMKRKNQMFTLLHCVTIYPTPLKTINLKRIDWLKQFTKSVGFSDHTLVERDGIKAALAAIYMGAKFIERHFTILPPNQTKDGAVSINSKHIKKLVKFSKLKHEDQKEYLVEKFPEWELMLGDGKLNLSHEELLNRDYYRGRFATHIDNKVIYNWDNVKIPL